MLCTALGLAGPSAEGFAFWSAPVSGSARDRLRHHTSTRSFNRKRQFPTIFLTASRVKPRSNWPDVEPKAEARCHDGHPSHLMTWRASGSSHPLALFPFRLHLIIHSIYILRKHTEPSKLPSSPSQLPHSKLPEAATAEARVDTGAYEIAADSKRQQQTANASSRQQTPAADSKRQQQTAADSKRRQPTAARGA
ncbi:hypothetical protein DFH09DRAFT_1094912 [Mycena vulgaris]|nr:hypothetical protein DFH09DRAFT_1094912 [Mycena vulgaris]